MPPRVKVTKEDIVSAAVELVRERGEEALNARSIAQRLSCSTQPIFSNFPSMYELKREVLVSINRIYEEYTTAALETAEVKYKASGRAYIDFARTERNFFKILFMRDRTQEDKEDKQETGNFVENIIDIIVSSTKMKREDARRFHGEMWVAVHGIATMVATGFCVWAKEDTDKMLSDFYTLKEVYEKNG